MAPKKTLHREKGSAGAGTQLAPPRFFPRPVIWVGSSKDDISTLPGPVKASLGHRLRQVQDGETPLDSLRSSGAAYSSYANASKKTPIGWCIS